MNGRTPGSVLPGLPKKQLGVCWKALDMQLDAGSAFPRSAALEGKAFFPRLQTLRVAGPTGETGPWHKLCSQQLNAVLKWCSNGSGSFGARVPIQCMVLERTPLRMHADSILHLVTVLRKTSGPGPSSSKSGGLPPFTSNLKGIVLCSPDSQSTLRHRVRMWP